jgi:hypothetical protein
MCPKAQVKAVLCAALYPNAAVMDESAGRSARPAWNDGVGGVFIHPSSINHSLEALQFLRPYLVYLEKVEPLLCAIIRTVSSIATSTLANTPSMISVS